MKARTSGASEPRERSGVVGPRERPPALFELWRGLAVALRAKAEACKGGRRGEAPRITMTALAVLVGGSSSVFACPMCFGAEETSMIDGTKLGVLVMLAITIAVQGAFAGFFFYLRKRAKRIAEIELDTEWSQLQRVSRT